MDEINNKLIKLLSVNADQTAKELSEQLNLSIPAINKRIAKLKSDGVIKSISAHVDASKIDKSILAYVMIIVDDYSQVDSVIKYINSDKDIVECHAITGEYDYILKMYAKDIAHLEEKLINIKKNTCISKSQTMFSLMEYKSLNGPIPD